MASRSRRGGDPDTQRERAGETRARIIAVARQMFAEAGFYATATTEIVARARLTRGALYHHFADKEDLFAQVFRDVAQDLVTRSNAAVAPLSGDLWPQVTEAFRQYLLLIASNEEYRRILLIDGQAVLGWSCWRELQTEFVASGPAEALQLLMNEGLVPPQPTMPLACMIQAALHDAAITIANSPFPSGAAEEAMAAFLFVLQGIRKD